MKQIPLFFHSIWPKSYKSFYFSILSTSLYKQRLGCLLPLAASMMRCATRKPLALVILHEIVLLSGNKKGSLVVKSANKDQQRDEPCW